MAVGADDEVHGTATLAWSRAGTVEAAFLVEDAWFRRGIGRALFAALAAEAARAGARAVVATVQADNDRAVRFLRSVTGGVRPRYVGGAELEVMVPVAPVAYERPRRAVAPTTPPTMPPTMPPTAAPTAPTTAASTAPTTAEAA